MKLDRYDLSMAVLRLPKNLKNTMKKEDWENKIYVGGGYLRAIVSGEKINDIDVFVNSYKDAEKLSMELAESKKDIYKTDNAFTIKGKVPVQIIHRWVFDKIEDVSNSFDFTICCAVFGFINEKFESFCDERFYIDIASKRLVYRNPIRNEDAGGSMLRVLKYYQRGYRIPLDSLGFVITRLIRDIDFDQIKRGVENTKEEQIAKVITGLLRVVDPNIDPLHEAHLPQLNEITEN